MGVGKQSRARAHAALVAEKENDAEKECENRRVGFCLPTVAHAIPVPMCPKNPLPVRDRPVIKAARAPAVTKSSDFSTFAFFVTRYARSSTPAMCNGVFDGDLLATAIATRPPAPATAPPSINDAADLGIRTENNAVLRPPRIQARGAHTKYPKTDPTCALL